MEVYILIKKKHAPIITKMILHEYRTMTPNPMDSFSTEIARRSPALPKNETTYMLWNEKRLTPVSFNKLKQFILAPYDYTRSLIEFENARKCLSYPLKTVQESMLQCHNVHIGPSSERFGDKHIQHIKMSNVLPDDGYVLDMVVHLCMLLPQVGFDYTFDYAVIHVERDYTPDLRRPASLFRKIEVCAKCLNGKYMDNGVRFFKAGLLCVLENHPDRKECIYTWDYSRDIPVIKFGESSLLLCHDVREDTTAIASYAQRTKEFFAQLGQNWVPMLDGVSCCAVKTQYVTEFSTLDLVD